MKKIIYSILIFATFSSCSKDVEQNLFIDEISGAYNITSLTITKSDLVTDSITLINAGEFVFEDCNIKKKKGQQIFCPGYYILNNESKFNFNYNKLVRFNEEFLQIASSDTPVGNNFIVSNSYIFEERTERRLALKAVGAVGIQGRLSKIKMILDRK